VLPENPQASGPNANSQGNPGLSSFSPKGKYFLTTKTLLSQSTPQL